MSTENEQAARAFLNDMSNPRPGLLADDFQLTVMGYGPSGGHRTGAEILALQMASAAAAAGDFAMKIGTVVASGDAVVVEAKGHLPLKSGDIYENEYCFHFGFEGGAIKTLRSYCDTAYAERFFPGL